MAFLGVLSCSAWLGYRAGLQTKIDFMVQANPLSPTVTLQRVGQTPPATPATENLPTPTPVAAGVSVVPAASALEGAERQAKAARFAELASLRNTVSELQAQVQALELEASGLEGELLDQQMAFAKAEEQWKEASVERRVVYNFTNIPVGGFVSEERIVIDAEQEEFPAPENDFIDQAESIVNDADPYGQYKDSDGPVELWNEDNYLADLLEQDFTDVNAENAYQADGAADQTAGGVVARYSSAEPFSTSGLSADNRTRLEVFFGPAEDRFENWVNQ